LPPRPALMSSVTLSTKVGTAMTVVLLKVGLKSRKAPPRDASRHVLV
jgi:hypothetical protein